jgi:preprotein translocase subunit SecB
MTEAQPPLQPIFNIEKIYVKDLSLEVPNSPQVFLQREAPQVDIEIQSREQKVDEGIYEVVVTVTTTARVGDKVFFLAEASQAGVFQIRNVPDQDIAPLLGIGCPNILFPYARETISDLVARAGFPPVILAPVNFEPIYQAKVQQQQQSANQVAGNPAPVTH